MHACLHMYACVCMFVFVCWPEDDFRSLPQWLNILFFFHFDLFMCDFNLLMCVHVCIYVCMSGVYVSGVCRCAWCVYVTHVTAYMWRPEKVLWSWFSPFIFMWNLGTELTLWSFLMKSFAHWGIFMNPLPYCWEYGFLLSLELADSAILGSQLSPMTFLSFCLPIIKDCKCTWLLLDSTGVPRSNCRSLCLHGKCFPDWAFSLALIFEF